ncbi:ribosomal RNA small subunit methyltransferase G [Clostridium acetireducens DSM 10703]|jgi:16S rRNA (guanine527-N7)-methyltransferase|uniref:Ribosomal RNA small subunit methyltransferase G n=1 Tax=Clostridium acetireducens DSM 10703 TaxID=1121290 RepID=A0A1E8EX71_9CLOT|nr:16S rRNA (guanine(527)-N(7))-methyltransferase RsmG [Clostridium acetireducens]OFI05393.1 ribosomal RNA small subunit methyltransferase G [Clostridium acetireducens DSM 10703]
MEYFDIMNRACQNEGINFDEKKYNKFISYKNLIKEWNEKVNLTAITEDEDIIKKHFIDCIKVFEFLPLKKAQSVIDIGTGAGFPGIPIKIIEPNINIDLLDSLNKRIKFLEEVIKELQLEKTSAFHGRSEDYGKDKNHREKYDFAVSRAVANMTVLSEWCIPFVKKGGYFIAMKGPSIEKELKDAKNAIKILGGKVEDIINVDIESTDLKHNLIIVKKVKETPKQYPRKAGVAVKRPLK